MFQKLTLKSLELMVVAILIFSAASVTTLERSVLTWESFVGPSILAVTSVSLIIIYRVRFSYKFAAFLCGYLVLFAAQGFIYGSFHPKHLLLYPVNFFAAYCIVRAFRKNVFLRFESVVVALTFVSLAIWSADLATKGLISGNLSGVILGTPYSSIVSSYIYVQTFINEGVGAIVPRNSGFAWEPGAFSVLCNLSLLFNLYRTRFSLRNNWRAGVLLAGILSSQSTTGFTIVAFIILGKAWHDLNAFNRLVLFPAVAAALTLAFASLPFMQEKIEDLWNQDVRELSVSASQDWNKDSPIAAQRFLSLKLDFSDFLNSPLTGYGGADEHAFAARERYNIVTVSGIGKILAKFGIFGFVFFIWCTVESSISVSQRYGVRASALLALVVFMISLSYSIIEHPLLICFWCFSFFDGFLDRRAVSSRTGSLS